MAIDLLQEKIRKCKNPSMVDFSVSIEQIPPHILREENSEILAYERFCRELLDGLRGIVPAVRFSMGHFSLLGPDGLFLMSRMTQHAKQQAYYVLVDAPECLSPVAAERAGEVFFSNSCLWQFDGLMAGIYAGSDVIKPYVRHLKDSGKDLFVVLRTANRSAPELQDLLTGSRLVHMAAADIIYRYTEELIGRSGYGQVAAIGPASAADVLKKLRGRYQKLFLLLDGYNYTNANARNCSLAFDRLGHGAIACAGSSITAAWDTDTSDGTDYVERAVEAAERMKKNLLRYITVL